MNELQKAGAQLTKPNKHGILYQDRMITGLWTQRSPLRDAASPYLQARFYGSRYDSIIDDPSSIGSLSLNTELTNKLTLIRRPGCSVFASGGFNPVNSFYSFRSTQAEQGTLYNVVVGSTIFSNSFIQLDAGVTTNGVIYNYAFTVQNTGTNTIGVIVPFTGVSTNLIAGAQQYFSGTFVGDGVAHINPSFSTLGANLGFSMHITPMYITANGANALTTNQQNYVVTGGSWTKTSAVSYSANIITPIRVIADTTTNVIDTNAGSPITLFTKSPNAGSTRFVTVGSTLYMSDGIQADLYQYDGTNLKPWGVEAPTDQPSFIVNGQEGGFGRFWARSQNVVGGYTILDNNGNVQLVGSASSVSGTTTPGFSSATVSANDYLTKWVFNNLDWEFNSHQLRTPGARADGTTAWTSANTFGLNVPLNATITGITVDVDWSSQSSSTTISNVQLFYLGTNYGTAKTPGAHANLGYNNMVAGGATDLWGATLTPAIVNDPSFGFGIEASLVHAGGTNRCFLNGYTITVNYTTTTGSISNINGTGASQTGATYPTWNTSILGNTSDGGTVWINCGAPSQWAANSIYTAAGKSIAVIDSNGYLQIATTTGVSGGSQPVWNTALNGTTTDNTITWTNYGIATTAIFSGVSYVYGYHTISGQVSTVSVPSDNTGAVLNTTQIVLTGSYSADTQVDAIWIFRTVDGGSSFLFCGTVPNVPGSGNVLTAGERTGNSAYQWKFTDSNPDSALNEFILAPINHGNDPPPLVNNMALTNLEYHLGRIWGSVGSTVYYSRVADSTAGDPLQSFPPLNYFVFPELVTRLWANPLGLFIFTVSNTYLILGQGTTASPLYAIPYLQGVGLLNYNAMDVNGAIAYLFTSDSQLISFDPTSGISEIGFPIGDMLGTWNPASVYVTWHVSGSRDKALYVSDGSTGWFRMSPTTAPESGLSWSPKATIVAGSGGCSAVQSIQTSPGIKKLLIGPSGIGGTGSILQRDYSVYTDNGTAYDAFATFGSIVLATHGQRSEVQFIGTDSIAVGTPLTLAVRLDEISGSFQPLTTSVPDPPQLPTSSSIYGVRFYFNQAQIPAWCRHLQVKVVWPAEAAASELLDFSIFGTTYQDK